MGKLTISMAIFNSFVSHYQRVTRQSGKKIPRENSVDFPSYKAPCASGMFPASQWKNWHGQDKWRPHLWTCKGISFGYPLTFTFCHGKIHHAIHGKIHYFDGHFPLQTVSSPEGSIWALKKSPLESSDYCGPFKSDFFGRILDIWHLSSRC